MSKKTSLKIINIIIALLIINQAITAIFSGLIGPDLFEILHEGGGVILLMGVILHIVLNWGWVRSSFFKRG
jgi:hypothetical protein